MDSMMYWDHPCFKDSRTPGEYSTVVSGILMSTAIFALYVSPSGLTIGM